MAPIKIVTDNTTSLPQSLVEKYDIRIVPLTIQLEDGTYREGVDLSLEEFYKKLRNSVIPPKTSQPPIGDFLRLYRELTDGGNDVLSIHFSSRLSGTFQAAQSAAQMVDKGDIRVVDSKGGSLFTGIQIIEAAKAIAQGKTMDEVIAVVQHVIDNFYAFITVQDLSFLGRSGRLSKSEAWLGNILSIKPIIVLEDGYLVPKEKVRTFQRAQNRLLQLAEEAARGHRVTLAAVHGNVPEVFAKFKEQVLARIPCEEFYENDIGSILSCHTGPGVLAIGVYVRE